MVVSDQNFVIVRNDPDIIPSVFEKSGNYIIDDRVWSDLLQVYGAIDFYFTIRF